VRRFPGEDSAAQRAYWLAELAQALDAAQRAVNELRTEGRAETAVLYARIEAASVEVRTLRLKRSGGGAQDFGPEWSDNLPWKRSA
jgi:G:T-mismatch repair DNA endonuclease (very short patch repair protein)